jgi:N6-L-threonylcarbamoyladenine synthase
LNFSFSGIKTAVYYEVEKLKKKKRLTPSVKKAVCAGFQEAVCDTLVQKSLRAAKRHGLGTLVVGGGVSANARLREKLKHAAQPEGLQVVFPPLEFCQDNAAMIAGLGAALYREGRRDTLDLASYSDFSKVHLSEATTREVSDAR